MHIFTKVIRIAAIAALFSVSVNASAQPVPNGGFESFTQGEPDGWITTNIPFLGIYTVVKSSDAHSGASAVRGDNIIAFSGDTIPASIITGTGSILDFVPGFAYTGNALAMEFYYKFTSVESDMLTGLIILTKNGESVGGGYVSLDASSEYAKAVVPIITDGITLPDTAQIAFSIASLNGESSPHPGSYFIIDDVKLVESTGSVDATSASTLRLLQNYPNPCNPSTTIPVILSQSGRVQLSLYNAEGTVVRRIHDGTLSAGPHLLKADLSGLATGVYTYELTAEGTSLRKRLILAK